MTIEPRLQTYWDWRAANNWIGGGTGSGLMIAAAVFTLAGIDSYHIVLLSLVFVSAGLLSVLAKIGRPLRALYVYRNPFTSWMSREAWVAFLVFGFGAAAFWLKWEILLIFAALSAYAYMFCQAMILKASRAIRAWRVQEVVSFVIISGVIEGAALALIVGILFSSLAINPALDSILIMLVLMIMFRMYTWRRYFNVLKNDAPEGTVDALAKANLPFVIAGDIIPGLLLLLGLISDQYIAAIAVAAGFLLILSGWYIKYVIVVRAGFYEGFAMPVTPARGAGEPGPGIKPGWVKKATSD